MRPLKRALGPWRIILNVTSFAQQILIHKQDFVKCMKLYLKYMMMTLVFQNCRIYSTPHWIGFSRIY